ncbi:MAG: energy-coupling factor transporter transmembrane component T [Lachnospiraceae bacterium]
MNGKEKSGLWFDPRTKLLLLLLTVLAATMAPSLKYELGLVVLVAVTALVCGEFRKAVLGLLAYLLFYLLTLAAAQTDGSALQATLIAFLGLFHKVYPCGFLASVMIATIKVSEFLSAMNRIHAPQKLVIPVAVMLRYMPAIREDWHFIKDAMRLRDVSPSFVGLVTHPVRTAECVYVPLMMAASKAADELSIASVTRGIENPRPRTCLVQIRFGAADVIAVLCFAAYFAAGQLYKGVFL